MLRALADEGQAVRRQIELGLEEGDFVEALSGVEAGERVIVAGQGGLKDGSPIKVATDAAGNVQPDPTVHVSQTIVKQALENLVVQWADQWPAAGARA